MFIKGLNHLGLVVEDIAVAKDWFIGTLQLELIQDRGELLFLKAGQDVLAIKTKAMAINKPEHGGESPELHTDNKGWQHLDHYGFYADNPKQVDDFSKMLTDKGIEIIKGPYDRSDGRSVYFKDPCGMVGEYFYFSPS